MALAVVALGSKLALLVTSYRPRMGAPEVTLMSLSSSLNSTVTRVRVVRPLGWLASVA
ncbi:hypothetical protein D3C84_1114980 [compost metagenome]